MPTCRLKGMRPQLELMQHSKREVSRTIRQGEYMSATDDELYRKIFELTAITGSKFMKTHVLEDWTLAKDIQALVNEYITKEKNALLDRLLEQAIPVIALTYKKPHKEVQIQAVPVVAIEAEREE